MQIDRYIGRQTGRKETDMQIDTYIGRQTGRKVGIDRRVARVTDLFFCFSGMLRSDAYFRQVSSK
jgi:hypothetical protein